MRNHRPYCLIEYDNNSKIFALLDSGSPFSFSPNTLLSGSNKQTRAVFNGTIQGPWLGSIPSKLVKTTSLKIGSVICKNLDIRIFDSAAAPHASFNLTLGNDFFKRYKTVTFDYPRRRLILEQY